MENLPYYVPLTFGLTTLLTVYLFYRATHFSKTFLITITGWIVIQSILSINGFYTVANTTPPRFLLLVVPTFIVMITLFATPKGRQFIDGLSLRRLTLLHTIRIPVEIVLFWLFTYKAVPELITFEGKNFDIFSGITAPIVFYVIFVKKILPKQVLLAWNFVCVGLLVIVVYFAVLSAPTPFQQFAFEQPNRAIQYFPFTLLPSVVVPLVLFSHIVAIRQILREIGERV